ncbi:ABC transporter permease [soil metagenome]
MALAEPTSSAGPLVEASRGGPLDSDRTRVAVLLVIVAVAVLSFVRVVTGTDGLTSSGTFGAALRLAVPILLAGLGAVYAERAGIVNIGLEGMMILGTWFGAWAGVEFGPWQGAAFGVIGGALGGLVHAVATVTFGIDHIVSGVAINILAAGVARFLSVIAFTGQGGGATQSPQVQGSVGSFSVPFLAGGEILGWQSPDLFGWLEGHHWFLVSDVGALVKGLTGSLSWLTVIAFVLVPISFWVLWKTAFGLRLRSVGEHPVAAESLGVRVYLMKYVGVVLSGGLAGLGGAFLVLEAAGIYREGQTAGRGFIGLAALIFGNWRPGGVLGAAGLFGYADGLKLRGAEHALLLLAAVLLLLGAVWVILRRRQRWPAAILVVFSAVFLWWWVVTDTVPREFVFFLPHITTLLVLSLASQRLRPPAADGVPYRKGRAL